MQAADILAKKIGGSRLGRDGRRKKEKLAVRLYERGDYLLKDFLKLMHVQKRRYICM